jgi:hypothetical protein
MVKAALVLMLALSCSAHAADKSSSGAMKRGPTIFFGVGAGKMNVRLPEEGFTSDGYLHFELGSQVQIFPKVKNLHAVLAGFAGLSSGKMDYQYRNPEYNQNYSYTDMKYSLSDVGLRMGVHMRVINSGWFRLFVEGGGFLGSATINYSTDDSTVKNQGSNYQKNQKEIMDHGWYADGGVDLMIRRYGLRAGVRQFNGKLGRITALDRQHVWHRTEIGYVAFIKDF